MGKYFYGWELAKTKANVKPESDIRVLWNTCKKELGGSKSVNAMKTTKKFIWKFSQTTNSLLEKFM